MTSVTEKLTVDNVLDRLSGVKKSGSGWVALCPVHDDHHPSLSVSVGDSGKVLTHCFACGAEHEKVLKALGLRGDSLNGSTPTVSTGNKPKKNGAQHVKKREGVTVATLAKAKGLPVELLREFGVHDSGGGGVVFTYYDYAGEESPARRTRYVDDKGQRKLRWKPKGCGEKIIVYGQAQRDRSNPVLWLVEGETDVLTAHHHGVKNVLGVPGAKMAGKLHSDDLKGVATVCVLKEPDSGGESFVQGVAKRLGELNFCGEAFSFELDAGDLNDLHRENPDHFNELLDESLANATRMTITLPLPVQTAVDATFPRPQSNTASRFADLYSEYTESPWEFLYFGFMTVLGAVLAPVVTLDSELDIQPRFYTVLLGQSGVTRKSSAIHHVIKFFEQALVTVPTLWGFGSAEGIAKYLKDEAHDEDVKGNPLLLVFDELRIFVEKAKAKGATAAPMLTSLFEQNHYSNSTKTRSIRLDDVYLSILTACTSDTFESMWTSEFRAIGFLNRLFLVAGESGHLVAFPRQIPQEKKNVLKAQLGELLSIVDAHGKSHGGVLTMSLTEDALALWEQFYRSMDRRSVYATRLDTIGMRLMPLVALLRGNSCVDESVVSEVVEVLNWQYQLRQLHDPSDSDNTIAKVEDKIRKALFKNGVTKKRPLQKKIHYERDGIWAWETAISNLIHNEEVAFDKDEGAYYLIGSKETTDSTPCPQKLSPPLSPRFENASNADQDSSSVPCPHITENSLKSRQEKVSQTRKGFNNLSLSGDNRTLRRSEQHKPPVSLGGDKRGDKPLSVEKQPNWQCAADGAFLDSVPGGFVCPICGKEYPSDGVGVFQK